MRHNVCNHTYVIQPTNFLMGRRCRKCAGSEKITQEEYIDRVYDQVGEEYTVLGKYINSDVSISIKHNICGYIWNPFPLNIVRGSRCPLCHESKGEREIRLCIQFKNATFNIEETFDGCKNKSFLPFDFYVDRNVLIEYDGEQHFKPIDYFGGEESFKYINNNDIIKNQYCIDNNIPLIRIPYWEFDNIEVIIDNVLKYFDITNGKCKDKGIVEDHYVRDEWNQDKYIAEAPCNIHH